MLSMFSLTIELKKKKHAVFNLLVFKSIPFLIFINTNIIIIEAYNTEARNQL